MALTIWLTDRSRHNTGLGHCRRDRYLSYHAGPHGYGWQRRAQSIPTTTGTLVHSPLGTILESVRRTGAIPTPAEVYQHAILPALKAYDDIVETRGLTQIADPTQLAEKTLEQKTLLEGLVWVWYWAALPVFHEEREIVSVEQEELNILGCTCGLGAAGTPEDHDARECGGVGWMTRADVISRYRNGGRYAYDEFKTTGQASMGWEAQWRHQVQLKAGVLGAEQRLGVLIDEANIHALIKGKNQPEWNPDEGKASGPKYQNSTLVYGYRRAANPPLYDEDWDVARYYVDDAGKRRKHGKEYERTNIHQLPRAWWQQGDCQSPVDFWVRWQQGAGADGKLADCYRFIGPFNRSQDQLDQFVRQIVGEERRWMDASWRLHELTEQGHGWGTPAFMALLDDLVPQTRGEACQNYFGESCPHLAICDKEPGWEDPALMGYIPRRPHHQPELQQAQDRGLLPPDGAGETPEEGN